MSQAKLKIRTKKTPNGLHLYAAYARGKGTYGWGDTPVEARTKLLANLARDEAAQPGA